MPPGMSAKLTSPRMTFSSNASDTSANDTTGSRHLLGRHGDWGR